MAIGDRKPITYPEDMPFVGRGSVPFYNYGSTSRISPQARNLIDDATYGSGNTRRY